MFIAYCDCYSGISFEMFLGAMVDAGLPLQELLDEVNNLIPNRQYEITTQHVIRNKIRARKLQLIPVDKNEMSHPAQAFISNLDAKKLITSSDLKPGIKQKSLDILRLLVDAETSVYGIPIDEYSVQDKIPIKTVVEIISGITGIDYFNIRTLYCSALPWGGGEISTDSGKMPVTNPVTLQLLNVARAQVYPVHSRIELITPVGAALLAGLAAFERPEMSIQAMGVGAGMEDLSWPNVLRFILGKEISTGNSGLVQMETNIDDMNPQIYGQVMDRLFAAGALDVFLTPIQMKKNRPAVVLGVIARHENEADLARIMLEETSTLGIRIHPIYRYEAERAFKEIQTEYGMITVKCKILDGKIIQVSPEYDVCLRAAKEKDVPVARVISAALVAGHNLLDM